MLSQGPGQFKYFPTVWSGLWYLHIYRPRPSTAASSVNGPIIFINGFTPALNLNWPWLTIRWLIITFIHVTNWMDIFQQIAPFTHYQCFIINQPNHLQCWLLPESQKKNNSCKKYFVNSPHRLTPAWEGQDWERMILSEQSNLQALQVIFFSNSEFINYMGSFIVK